MGLSFLRALREAEGGEKSCRIINGAGGVCMLRRSRDRWKAGQLRVWGGDLDAAVCIDDTVCFKSGQRRRH